MYDASIAASIAVVGWLINHKLALRAQKKKFLNDIKNDARLKISEAIRDYQDWLSALNGYFVGLEVTLTLNHSLATINWVEEHGKFQKVACNSPRKWNWLLEEYRILFPETNKVRVILQRRDYEIEQLLLWFEREFWLYHQNQDDISGKMITYNEAKRWFGYLLDQACLADDLRVYLQNHTLSDITGNKVPERNPCDKNICRVKMMDDKYLDVVNGEGQAIERKKLPFSVADLWKYPID